MDDQNKDFNTLCRVCLQHDSLNKMISLVDNTGENLSPYGTVLETISNIPVLENRYLPTKICLNCKKFLEEIVEYTNKYKNSHWKLCKVIDYSSKKELADDLIKEVVKQYSDFNQNHRDEETVNNINLLTEDTFHHKGLKVEGEYSDIKVEIDIQNLQNDDFCSKKPVKTDNVDIFLYSIDKLLQLSTEMTQKTRQKPQKKRNKPPEDLTCRLCQKVLANPLTYRHHMERHGKCRYVCDQCGKGFPVLAELTKHQIYRHGYGSSLICDICSYKAARKFELVEHMRLHTGERPFTCEKCGLSFRRKAIYRNHLVSHGEKTIQCQYCPKKFFRKSHMLLHINNIHDRTFLFQCSICNVTYAKDKTVRRHMLVKHGIPREKQGKVLRLHKNTDASYFEEGKVEEVNYDS